MAKLLVILLLGVAVLGATVGAESPEAPPAPSLSPPSTAAPEKEAESVAPAAAADSGSESEESGEEEGPAPVFRYVPAIKNCRSGEIYYDGCSFCECLGTDQDECDEEECGTSAWLNDEIEGEDFDDEDVDEDDDDDEEGEDADDDDNDNDNEEEDENRKKRRLVKRALVELKLRR